MKDVIHQNFIDSTGKIYCKKQHMIIRINPEYCSTCEYCFGSLQGDGVECRWMDEQIELVVAVNNPRTELLRVKKLIKENRIKKG